MRARLALWVAMGAYATGFSVLSILRHDAYNTGRYDLGNMVQTVWNTAHGRFLQMTSGEGEQISRLAAHFDPILAAFAPLWWVWPDPGLLLVVQAVAVALGALPVFRLARRKLARDDAALAFALVYLLYPATQWLTLNEFHPVALACPLLLFAFDYLDQDRLLAFSLAAGAAVLTKEEVGLAVAGLGLWYAIARRRRAAGAAVAAGGALVSALAVAVVIPHFNDGRSAFYGRYDEVGGSPGGILETLFTDPVRLLGATFEGRDLQYLLELGAPLLALFVLAPLVLLAALPELALNLWSDTVTQTSIRFHYTAALIPALLAGAVLGSARLSHRAGLAAAAALAAVVVANYRLGAIPLWSSVPGGQRYQHDAADSTEHDRVSDRALRLVPAGAVVSATNALGAHLSERRRVLSWPKLGDATWVAVDETRSSYADRVAPIPAAAALVSLRRNPRWKLVFAEDGVLVFQKRSP